MNNENQIEETGTLRLSFRLQEMGYLDRSYAAAEPFFLMGLSPALVDARSRRETVEHELSHVVWRTRKDDRRETSEIFESRSEALRKKCIRRLCASGYAEAEYENEFQAHLFSGFDARLLSELDGGALRERLRRSMGLRDEDVEEIVGAVG